MYLKKLEGVRSAIMALVLLLEVLSKAFGLEAGPVFTILHLAFTALGWNPADANTLFDPALVGSAILTLYVTTRRVVAWSRTLSK